MSIHILLMLLEIYLMTDISPKHAAMQHWIRLPSKPSIKPHTLFRRIDHASSPSLEIEHLRVIVGSNFLLHNRSGQKKIALPRGNPDSSI